MTYLLRLGFLTLIAAFLTSCGDSEPIEITESRVIDPETTFELPTLAESDQHRFRYRSTSEADDSEPQGAAKLTWNTPDGWKDVDTTSMREANLRFGENDEGECYVTRLSGMGGGMVANVNRWRKQIGADELTAEQIDALPKKTLFGQPATLVSVDGAFAGMGGPAKEDYRLHGIILNINGAMVTVKMTGPRELVIANETKFDAFCASLDIRS